MLPETCEVLVIGAGPVGLTVAATLARRGVRPLVIERAETPQTTSRAAVIHAHTLEILDRIGVADDMLAAGRKITKFAFRDRDRLLGLIRFDHLPSEHRYLLMLPQDRTEAILLDRLAALDVEVMRGASLIGLREEGQRVIAEVEIGEARRTVSARYVVGADGMHSLVRESCGIAFDGAPYEGSFVLADGNEVARTGETIRVTKNGKLRPNDVVPGSAKRVWWRCAKGQAWWVAVNARTALMSSGGRYAVVPSAPTALLRPATASRRLIRRSANSGTQVAMLS